MLQSYDANQSRTCLSLQHLTIHGGTEAQQVFLSLAQSLDQRYLRNISEERDEGRLTVLKSGMARVGYQEDSGFGHDELAYRGDPNFGAAKDPRRWNDYDAYNTSRLASFYVSSSNRNKPFNDDNPHLVVETELYFTADDLGSPSAQAQIVLNSICNEIIEPRLRQTQAYCCANYAGPSLLQKVLLLAGSCAILVHFYFSLLRGKVAEMHDNNARSASQIRRVLAAIATVSVTILICFVADRTALLDKTSKVVDLTSFIWLTSIVCLTGVLTWTRSQPAFEAADQCKEPTAGILHFLSRQQTEEWKGWMQIVILMYHYFGLSKVLWVYQFVRLLVSSYLFMTGFGHATYFINTNDFSLRRISIVLLRSNILNVVLAFALDTRYDLYYFPVLTSVWFLVTWATIPRTTNSGINMVHCFRRLVMSAITVRLVLGGGKYIESLLNNLNQLHLGLPTVDAYEFLFRFGLDAYIPYIGMSGAILFTWLNLGDSLPRNREKWMTGYLSRVRSRLAIPTAVLVVPAYALFCRLFSNKILYNKWHPFVSPLPVLAFVILRNSTLKLRSYHSRLFAWFGRCSLETFVLQYHIWLAADSHGQLRLGLFKSLVASAQSRYMLNLAETVLIFTALVTISFATSKALSTLTRSLVDLKAEILLVLAGLWMVNLAGGIFPVLSQHYHYD